MSEVNSNSNAEKKPKADLSKYAISTWDDSRIKKAAAGLERYAPTSPGQGIMFAVIPGAPIVMAPTHYVSTGEDDDQRGTYICLRHLGKKPICCDALEDPTIRVNVLAAVYTNANNTGRLVKGVKPEVTVGYIRLSAGNHQAITNMLPDGADVTAVDITMTKAKRPGYDFALLTPGSKPRYIEAGLQDEVMQAAEKWLDGQALVRRLGKELSLLGWRMLLKHLGAEVTAGSDSTDAEEPGISGLDSLKGIGEADDEDVNSVDQ